MTNGDLKEIRDLIETFTVPAAARSGAIAPVEVVVPPQNTGLGPEKTSFFQALSVPTKIARGSIEITSAVPLLVWVNNFFFHEIGPIIVFLRS